MRHPIDPKVDCVFKALLGAEANSALLIHFLNAVLGPDLPRPITAVRIMNPYNEKEFLDDKLSIVDVKATDDAGCLYQVELQLTFADLGARIVYGWADLYSSQLKEGQDYDRLRPTYSIWLLGSSLIDNDPAYAHSIRLRNSTGQVFGDHGGIWLLEIPKFAAEIVETEQERWIRFFKEGAMLDPDNLPSWMNTPEMRQAMSTVTDFSEKEREYHLYQARLNYQRQQRSIQHQLEARDRALARTSAELEQARAAEIREREAKEHEREAKERALAEIETLRRQLKGQQPS